jgi:hypothetical protein
MPYATTSDGIRLYYEEVGAGRAALAYKRTGRRSTRAGMMCGTILPDAIMSSSSIIAGRARANAYLLAERIPGAELCIVEGGRHGYFVEFREEASRVVNDFLACHPL